MHFENRTNRLDDVVAVELLWRVSHANTRSEGSWGYSPQNEDALPSDRAEADLLLAKMWHMNRTNLTDSQTLYMLACISKNENTLLCDRAWANLLRVKMKIMNRDKWCRLNQDEAFKLLMSISKDPNAKLSDRVEAKLIAARMRFENSTNRINDVQAFILLEEVSTDLNACSIHRASASLLMVKLFIKCRTESRIPNDPKWCAASRLNYDKAIKFLECVYYCDDVLPEDKLEVPKVYQKLMNLMQSHPEGQ
jgi:hypothetical protein